jgi:quinol monooxygenase YgiN
MPLTLPILPEADRGETGPYCVIAQHRAKPGLADALEQRMLADIPLTRAEPGCLQFHLHRDRADRNLFVVYEIWRDLAALKFHFDQPYVRQFVADASPMEAGDMSVQWLIMSSSLPHPLTGR